MQNVIRVLKQELRSLQSQQQALLEALTALGEHKQSKRRLSKQARHRIAEAQRKRWAKVRAQKGKVKLIRAA